MSYISIHRVPRTIRLRCLPLALGVLALCGSACHTAETERRSRPLPEPFQKLLPLHKKVGPPEPGDWLTEHFEPGQTYWEYVHGQPVKPEGQRRVIYVQPLGTFTQTQRKIVGLAAEYMGLYFGLPTRLRESLPLNLIPAKARRKHPSWGIDQILSTYVLKRYRSPAAQGRRGIYCLHGFGPLARRGLEFRLRPSLAGRARGRLVDLPLRRPGPERRGMAALPVADAQGGHARDGPHVLHAALHALRVQHVAGNHLAEMDRYPLWLCPQCLAKLCWATGADPAKRFERLAEFSKKQGMKREQEFFERSLAQAPRTRGVRVASRLGPKSVRSSARRIIHGPILNPKRKRGLGYELSWKVHGYSHHGSISLSQFDFSGGVAEELGLDRSARLVVGPGSQFRRLGFNWLGN